MKHLRRNDPEIYDNLLYVGMNETGNVLVPMTGWDVQQIACGSYIGCKALRHLKRNRIEQSAEMH